MMSAHRRQLDRPGRTRGPTTPLPSRMRTERWGSPQRTRSLTKRGSVTTSSARTTSCSFHERTTSVLRYPRERRVLTPLVTSARSTASDSGPTPWIRTVAVFLRAVWTKPESASCARNCSVTDVGIPRLDASQRMAARDFEPSIVRRIDFTARASTPAGSVSRTARPGVHPSCSRPSGRDRTAIRGSHRGPADRCEVLFCVASCCLSPVIVRCWHGVRPASLPQRQLSTGRHRG